MSNWEIILDGVIQDSGQGNEINFVFPKNEGETDKVYHINYTGNSSECTATTIYTVLAHTCSCDDFSVDSSVSLVAAGWSGEHGHWNDDCKPSISSKPEWATVEIKDDKTIVIGATENKSADARSGSIVFAYGNNPCTDKTVAITQNTSTKCYTISPRTITCEGGNNIRFTATENTCSEYVEIGGVKWATKNLGANSVTDYGLYFQWGDTSGYTASQVGTGSGQKSFLWPDYKYWTPVSCGGSSGLTKYNTTDNIRKLETIDDAASVSLGGNWRMPTEAEFVALGNAVNTAWTADYQGSGVAGVVCTDKTDSSKVLFFPATGALLNNSTDHIGQYGYYWTSSAFQNVNKTSSYVFLIRTSAAWQHFTARFFGMAIRPVRS